MPRGIHEILGKSVGSGLTVLPDYKCPFIEKECTKRSGRDPYPVCSVYYKDKPAIICPKRFFQVDFLKEIVTTLWPAVEYQAISVAQEVGMQDFGTVDFVAVMKNEDNIIDFISIELQTIDITGTVQDYYNESLTGQVPLKRRSYGLNFDNVYKRYVTQLIRKGFYHHQWRAKIVSVIPDTVYDYIKNKFDLKTQIGLPDHHSSIVFFVYSLGGYKLVLKQISNTSHSDLMNAVIYASPPSKEVFIESIRSALGR